MVDFIRCRIADQSHYIDGSMLAALILRISGDDTDKLAVRNTIDFLIGLQNDSRTKATWISSFGFSPRSMESVEFVLSQGRPPSFLKPMLMSAVMARSPIDRIGVGHLVFGDDPKPDADALRRLSALAKALRCLPVIQNDLRKRDEAWKWIGRLGGGIVFWKQPAVLGMYDVSIVGCVFRGLIQ